MKCNVGEADRMVRFIVGAAIIVAGVIYKSWWGAVGIIPILTGAIRWCPGYLPFGLSTCKDENK
jgi:Protein of unknown function (DUF2892)